MAYNPEEDIKVADLPEKTTQAVANDELLIVDSQDLNILKRISADKLGTGGGDLSNYYTKTETDNLLDGKQDELESGVNIKTINNISLLGAGNMEIQGGGTVDTAMSGTSTNAVQNKVIKEYVDSKTGMKVKIVSFTMDTASLTITHDLGVVPDFMELEYREEPYEGTGFATYDGTTITQKCIWGQDSVSQHIYDGEIAHGYYAGAVTITNITDTTITLQSEVTGPSSYPIQGIFVFYCGSNGGGSGGDSNIKVFSITTVGTEAILSEGQAVLDWYLAGKTPVILYNNSVYNLLGKNSGILTFILPKFRINTNNESTSLVAPQINIVFNSSNVVTQIYPNQNSISHYLDTAERYNTPYTPLYDGSPATKKYVDDAVATAGGGCKSETKIVTSIEDRVTNIYHSLGVAPKAVLVTYVAKTQRIGSSSIINQYVGQGSQSFDPSSVATAKCFLFETKAFENALLYATDSDAGTYSGTITLADKEMIKITMDITGASSSYDMFFDVMFTFIG